MQDHVRSKPGPKPRLMHVKTVQFGADEARWAALSELAERELKSISSVAAMLIDEALAARQAASSGVGE